MTRNEKAGACDQPTVAKRSGGAFSSGCRYGTFAVTLSFPVTMTSAIGSGCASPQSTDRPRLLWGQRAFDWDGRGGRWTLVLSE